MNVYLNLQTYPLAGCEEAEEYGWFALLRVLLTRGWQEVLQQSVGHKTWLPERVIRADERGER